MEWVLLAAAVLLTVGTGVFVAAEFALVTLDRPAVERAVAGGDRAARPVLTGLRTLSTQLSGAQVGITLTTLLLGYLAQPGIAVLLQRPLAAAGLGETATVSVSLVLALVLATGLSIFAGELVPKNLALSAPLATAKWAVPPQLAFTLVMRPLIVTLNGVANRALRALGVEPAEELSAARYPDELAALVRRSAELGTLERGTAERITRSIDVSARTAADLMTPRTRVSRLTAEGGTAADVVALSRTTGHSRFPVVGSDLDDVLGVVHLKHAVAVPREQRADTPLRSLVSDVVRVPGTLRLGPLLRQLRHRGLQVALVVDEYGGLDGLVTLEDVVEEIVGEVADEHDRLDGQRPLRTRDAGWLLPGLLRPDEVREQAGVEIPDGADWETVGGYVMAQLGRIPRVGDRVAVPAGELVVLRMEGRRVDRVRFSDVPGATLGTRTRSPAP